MTDSQALVKTLDFQLNIQSDNESLLEDATLESRWAYNETIRLAKQGVDWDAIPDRVAANAYLVKNTTQRVVAKTLGAMENYHEYDDFGLPSHTTDGAYPLRANYEEGYNLTFETTILSSFASVLNRTSTSEAYWKATTHTSIFSEPRSLVTSGRLGRRKHCSITEHQSCTSTAPTPNRPSGRNRALGRSSAWT